MKEVNYNKSPQIHSSSLNSNQGMQENTTSMQLLQSVISSNEQIIKSQSNQIRALHLQLMEKQEQLNKSQKQCTLLKQRLQQLADSSQTVKNLTQLQNQLHLLQQQLISAKLQLAIKSSDSLEKDVLIRDLNHKNRLMDQEMEKRSVISTGENAKSSGSNDDGTKVNGINGSSEKTPSVISGENDKFTLIEINQSNLEEYIQPTNQLQSFFNSIKSLIDTQLFKKPNQPSTILQLWQKQVTQHILPKPKRFSFSSTSSKQLHLQKFMKETFPLVRKHCGIPHVHRNKVWPFVMEDKLGITNALYIQLVERRAKGWVAERVKLQIERDILRSFSGEGSKEKLMKIHQVGLMKAKSESEENCKFARRNTVSTVGETEIMEGSIEPQLFPKEEQEQNHQQVSQQCKGKSYRSSQLITKQQPLPSSPTYLHLSTQFRIAQDVTQVLQLFYIYRPDIGFVQGMTYPTIILTLAVGKLNSFKILCNLLLCSDFFRKMITFEPNFINYFCRIFDELLLSFNLNLYNRLLRQFEIRSEVFLVDWFFTFFSRGITPLTILRIWDLFLYHTRLTPKIPQLLMYRLSLIIFQLLEPILMQSNYEQSIRAIRQYPRKLDQEQLVKKLYQAMRDWERFEEKYLKVKKRVEKRYEAEMDGI